MSSFILTECNILSEADSKFIADNMLTADDFDVSSLLMDETDAALHSISNTLSDTMKFDIGKEHLEYIVDCFPNLSNSGSIELKMEPVSPTPSPAESSSGYSSPEWSEDLSTTEVKMTDSDFLLMETSNQYQDGLVDAFSFTSGQLNHVKDVNMTGPTNLLKIATSPITLHNSNHHNVKGEVPQFKSSAVMQSQQSPINQHTLSDFAPLVLTSQEFAKLTTSGNLPMEHNTVPLNTNRKQRSASIVPVLRNKKLVANANIPTQEVQVQDPVAVKRQQRMMKNRESAYLSRKKKKEYVQNLEQQLTEITNENNRIKTENSFLKNRIEMLEKEICRLKKIFSGKDFKKNTCLMVMIFLVTFNLSPLNGIFLRGDSNPVKIVESNPKLGRTLLWNPENAEPEDIPLSFGDKIAEENLITLSSEYKNASCPTYINKTESIRLEKELRVWAQQIEKQKQKRKPRRTPSLKALRKQLLVPMPRLQNFMRSSRSRFTPEEIHGLNSKGIELFQPLRIPYEDLFEALNRKDDTFYFVSFSGDHLLLPASAHNRTLRPKMSLVMPAMALNDTAASNRVTMMQIDCEVMNTKMVYVKESAIPHHMRHKVNGTDVKNEKVNQEEAPPTTIFSRKKKQKK